MARHVVSSFTDEDVSSAPLFAAGVQAEQLQALFSLLTSNLEEKLRSSLDDNLFQRVQATFGATLSDQSDLIHPKGCLSSLRPQPGILHRRMMLTLRTPICSLRVRVSLHSPPRPVHPSLSDAWQPLPQQWVSFQVDGD